MSIDDRAAYGQTHPHSMGLCRKKGAEQLVDYIVGKTMPRITYRNLDVAFLV
jgi:hypothetical protein